MQYLLSKENIEFKNTINEIESFNNYDNDNNDDNNNVDLAYKYICHKHENINDIFGCNLLNDIELFTTFSNNDNDDTLFKQLSNYITTGGGKCYLKYLLLQPLCDQRLLVKRQQTIMSTKSISLEDMKILQEIKENEKTFLWLFTEQEETISDIYKLVYYRSTFTSWLNGDAYALTGLNLYSILISPSIGILSPIFYFVVPYLVLYFRFKIRISFLQYIQTSFQTMFLSTSMIFGKTGGIFDNFKYISYAFSLIFYFQSLLNSVEMSTTMYKISKLLTNKINSIIEFIQKCKTLVDKYWKDEIPENVFGCKINNNGNVNKYFENTTTEPFSIFSNFGSKLQIFKNIVPTDYIPLAQKLYMLDTIWTIKEKVEKDQYTYTTFTNGRVKCEMTQFRHPCIPIEKVINNDISLGGKSKTRNIIITGPNAGGKSTLIKSILSNTVISQTLTIAAAKKYVMTPFHLIHSQINIPDCKGKESLFEAEMHRSKNSIDMLNKCQGPSLIIMDEIFNSTNPIEGISGAYAIAKSIGSFKSNLTIICTHYLYLTNLSKELKHFEKSI